MICRKYVIVTNPLLKRSEAKLGQSFNSAENTVSGLFVCLPACLSSWVTTCLLPRHAPIACEWLLLKPVAGPVATHAGHRSSEEAPRISIRVLKLEGRGHRALATDFR